MTFEELEAQVAAAAFLDQVEKVAAGKAVMLSASGPPKVRSVVQPPKHAPIMKRPGGSFLRDKSDDHVKEGAAKVKGFDRAYSDLTSFQKKIGLPVWTKRQYLRFIRGKMKTAGKIGNWWSRLTGKSRKKAIEALEEAHGDRRVAQIGAFGAKLKLEALLRQKSPAQPYKKRVLDVVEADRKASNALRRVQDARSAHRGAGADIRKTRLRTGAVVAAGGLGAYGVHRAFRKKKKKKKAAGVKDIPFSVGLPLAVTTLGGVAAMRYHLRQRAAQKNRERLAGPKTAAVEKKAEVMQKGDAGRILKGMGVVAGGAALGAGGGLLIRRALAKWGKKMIASGNPDKVRRAVKVLRAAEVSPLGSGILGGFVPAAYMVVASKRDKAMREVVRGGRKR